MSQYLSVNVDDTNTMAGVVLSDDELTAGQLDAVTWTAQLSRQRYLHEHHRRMLHKYTV